MNSPTNFIKLTPSLFYSSKDVISIFEKRIKWLIDVKKLNNFKNKVFSPRNKQTYLAAIWIIHKEFQFRYFGEKIVTDYEIRYLKECPTLEHGEFMLILTFINSAFRLFSQEINQLSNFSFSSEIPDELRQHTLEKIETAIVS